MLPVNQLFIKVFRQKWQLWAIAFFFFFTLTFIIQEQKTTQHKTLETKIKEIGKNSKIPKKSLNQTELKEIAKLVNVRVFANIDDYEIGGSGVIIGQRKNSYLVLTNNHVVDNKEINYQIQTHTGKIYKGEVIWQNNDNLIVDDLALLTFESQEQYQTINIKNNYIPKKNELILASGFPFQDNLKQSENIKYTFGNLSQVLPKPLIGGYQIGYTNNVHSGMSGGSILNLQGQLIGINGLGKYPPLGNPYIYQNGNDIPENQVKNMSNLSWGISSQSINKLISKVEQQKNIDFQIQQVE
ncbi:trypsin-like peptidase domain-containing protein [Cyanobacterium aponinum FACHB-4101]|uniref:S1 family peptidase n=1 Tax=Cyanobacterium aponinum TaxID=379064 RepID=UPI0016809A30|nr:serine protease [Cyanobacterium aponinum]MBD2393035.1 trypsin-like peptidase domain-containing protein [Cyanobacterium aponinum FACHB-4101]